jgi:hypothetical protein
MDTRKFKTENVRVLDLTHTSTEWPYWIEVSLGPNDEDNYTVQRFSAFVSADELQKYVEQVQDSLDRFKRA